MLIQLTIENFLSFKEEITFSMVGINSDKNYPNHLAVDAAGKGKSLLPISAIYGANAAGKSNLIKAINFAQDLIVQGTRSGQTIPVIPFKLGNDRNKPSKFEFIFIYNDSRYSYGFKLKADRIIEEWLYVIPSGKKREVPVFVRVTSEKKETTVEYGATLKGKGEKDKPFLDFIARGTRPNQLFLTEALDRNVQAVKPVVEWFEDVLTIIQAESNYIHLESGILNSQEFTSFLTDFLRLTGTGIDSIGTEEVELDFDRHFPEIPENIKNDILETFSEDDDNFVGMLLINQRKRYLIAKRTEDKLNLIQLKTQHRHQDGSLVDFLIEEESEGTQRLIDLIPVLFVLKNSRNKVIFLDELDRRLHPLLSRKFIEFCLSCRNKNNRTQLIFTTHDTNLLDLDLLRRDEIWFVEKNQEGASHLYSLAEFKTKPELKIEKGYLNGRFGAIPFFGDIRNLGWFDCEKESSEAI
ncbi:MAG TPA: hypothetical protein DEG17_25900 [Cyanobacteria bacterium UBA11149]|nr:hypothetical protein [Cyanobacteria bacterium UBA11367]HBE61131.1 hypothetical protein [Cyanobacteria bacterium UBA11366]HBK64738.1 hypothetical protein [Cyanobacteria bacterium UBA11166]HBR74680.1 hypothetical protein [Cyanobacteria bacterium UBA11159]HBS70096.1 hypothetical protein [Cyanobacteria bacterium UBA11153]HBW92205.1 hypothetical protein [Cyanobacteria bacterium UBA11149]HCA95198.1 hypothetical protein [Cyanobacteria bacterium UBA9226]